MKDSAGWDLEREYPEYEPIQDRPLGLENYEVVGIMKNFGYLQIIAHGCYYTCPMKTINGESYFRFKNKLHKTNYYTTPNTRINNLGDSN